MDAIDFARLRSCGSSAIDRLVRIRVGGVPRGPDLKAAASHVIGGKACNAAYDGMGLPMSSAKSLLRGG